MTEKRRLEMAAAAMKQRMTTLKSDLDLLAAACPTMGSVVATDMLAS